MRFKINKLTSYVCRIGFRQKRVIICLIMQSTRNHICHPSPESFLSFFACHRVRLTSWVGSFERKETFMFSFLGFLCNNFACQYPHTQEIKFAQEKCDKNSKYLLNNNLLIKSLNALLKRRLISLANNNFLFPKNLFNTLLTSHDD